MTLRGNIGLSLCLLAVLTPASKAEKPFETELARVDLHIESTIQQVEDLNLIMRRIGVPPDNWAGSYEGLDQYARYHDAKNFQAKMKVELEYLNARRDYLRRAQHHLLAIHAKKEDFLQDVQLKIEQILLDEVEADNRQRSVFNTKMEVNHRHRQRIIKSQGV